MALTENAVIPNIKLGKPNRMMGGFLKIVNIDKLGSSIYSAYS